MRVLLDTNVVIHREAYKTSHLSIGQLFRWLDELKYNKCIHPITEIEIKSHANQETVRSMGLKMESYYTLKTIAPVNKRIQTIIDTQDKTQNDINDSLLLNEVVENRVDIFITEDRKLHQKAAGIGVGDKIYTISHFVEKCMSEHPELVNYKVLSIQKVYFGNINVGDNFFESFRNDYPDFNKSPDEYKDNEPHRNALSKVYISHSYERALKPGDIILFYRTGGKYIGVATTLGIVEKVYNNIESPEQLIGICRKKTFFTSDQLLEFWDRYDHAKPFVVEFLYSYSFPKRPNLAKLVELGIVSDIMTVPRGFSKISLEQLYLILKESKSDESIIVN